jgi:hypothetical protein
MDIDVKKKYVSDEELKLWLLRKLLRHYVGKSYHIYEADLSKGSPKHLRKRIIQTAYELKRVGLLVSFPHSGEQVWQLNLERIKDIKEKLGDINV